MNTLADKIQEKISTKSLSTSSSQPSSDPTPECVVRYTSFLKDRYKQMSPFSDVYRTLYKASPKWYNLGLALGLDTGTLNIIEHDNKECETCLRKALDKRHAIRRLTWAEIDQALRQTTVQMNTLADKIQEMASKQSLSTSSSQPSSDPTPECVVRYTSFLKDRYKQMSPFSDDWPPPLKEKFTKLALIERKKHIRLTQAKHQPSIQYDYATGNVDNIVERKKAITLEQVFEPLSGDSEIAAPNRYTVVMDGAPGVGKTTLSRKICIDWAQGKLIKDHHIVILKPLRELRDHTAASLSDLIKTDDFKQHEREEILDHIKSTSGSGVMFIFDGFDDLSSKQRSDKNTIFWNIIRGNYLHNCSVLVTSHSYASGPLQVINRVNRHIEVLGFKKKDIEHCIKQNVTDKTKAKKLIQMLKERLDIVSLCYIPLNCRIVLYVYQQQDTLPDTLTQLYEVFILYTLKHYKNKIFQEQEHEIDNEEIEHANTIKKLPHQVIKCLDCLSETAFTGMTQDKLIFKHTEVTKERGALSLGLLNLIKCTGVLEAHYYHFLNLTIQEFLAARHLALTKSNKDKLEFITSKIGDDRFRMTLLFLSGLTQLDFLPIEQAFPAPKSIDPGVEHKYKTKTKDLRKQEISRFLFLAHLQYESRQTTHNWLLPCLVTNSLNLSEHSLSQFDCLVLANFLALTPKDHVWDEINLSQCSLNNDRFKTIITKEHSQRDIPVLCLTKQLDVTSNNIKAEDLHVLMPLLSVESKVDSISIPHYESCTEFPELGDVFVKGLRYLYFGRHSTDHNQTVLSNREMIVPTHSKICSGILTKFFEVIRLEVLKRLSLAGPKAFDDCPDCSGSGNEAWESVCNVIKNSKYIQHLQIHKSQFHLYDITTLMASLQNKRNLRTLRLHGNTISLEGLIHLRNNLPVNVRAHISTSEKVKLAMSVHKDKLVHVDIESPDKYIQDDDSEHLFMPLLENLPSELHGVTVTTKSFVSKALLRSIGNSKTVTSLTLANLSNEKLTKCAGEFQDMLKKTNSLQTLKLDTCELNDTSIKQFEDRLLLNPTVALKLKDSSWGDSSYINSLLTVRSQNLSELSLGYTLTEERVRQLSEIVKTCKQLRVLKVKLSDNSESFFHALSDNQSLRELSIKTTGKMATLLFQTLPSTSVTTLELSKLYDSEGLGNEGSLAFKEYIHGSKVLTVLRVHRCGLTDETFKGITFTKDSPLRELILKDKYTVKKGWTELFNGLCSSCITTLDVSDNILHGEECCTALKRLLISNKTLAVLKIGHWYETNDDLVGCIADALSQNCSLMELTINHRLSIRGWTKLFESLHENTTLNTLDCSEASLQELDLINEVAKSLCEMLIHNQGL
ncbi:protein NLRC3-like isoform X1 [Halichondria panicea]|uniref:protein NLRC3-like isoform X1 n=1 Tax=Halichondria panicea TaxID=6063 RepID=UPI00312B39AD